MKLETTTRKINHSPSTYIPENTNTSLEASPTDNVVTIVNSRPVDTNHNETKGTYFNSTLLEDRTLFSSHTVNTLSLMDLENYDNNSNHYINYNDFENDTKT